MTTADTVANASLISGLTHSTTFWVAIALVAFIALVWRAGSRAITGWLDGKITRIQHDLDEAARLRREAEALLAEAQARHASATTEAAQIIADAQSQASAMAAAVSAETEKHLARREQQVIDRIQQAERQALSDVQRQTVAAALSVVRDIMTKELTPQQKEALTQKAVNDIGKVAS